MLFVAALTAIRIFEIEQLHLITCMCTVANKSLTVCILPLQESRNVLQARSMNLQKRIRQVFSQYMRQTSYRYRVLSRLSQNKYQCNHFDQSQHTQTSQ